ncbi:MAG: cobalt ECF transporter T component CbiQ [Fibromonadales bacterium]|nr:cobalt ECF transporter T component CbiQ [Fibromonadales bacterium]
MKHRIQELNALEQLSGGDTFIHRLHPMAKLLSAVFFIITVISHDRYALRQLIPYVFYPTLLMALSETPYSMLLKRFMVAFPFCFFAGVSNLIFVPAPYGVISFFTIIFRTYLCVMAVLLLVSTTPFFEIANSLRFLKIPNIFIIIFEMTYRYICVLLEEVHSMYIAYSLRSASAKGIKMRDMGSFAGQLLLRSFDRADRIYNAMKCRGYALHILPHNGRNFMLKDFIFFAAICFFCIWFRFQRI